MKNITCYKDGRKVECSQKVFDSHLSRLGYKVKEKKKKAEDK
jgi:hypothetical protein